MKKVFEKKKITNSQPIMTQNNHNIKYSKKGKKTHLHSGQNTGIENCTYSGLLKHLAIKYHVQAHNRNSHILNDRRNSLAVNIAATQWRKRVIFRQISLYIVMHTKQHWYFIKIHHIYTVKLLHYIRTAIQFRTATNFTLNWTRKMTRIRLLDSKCSTLIWTINKIVSNLNNSNVIWW